MSAHPDERIDALRQQLRALGYLDAGVDRFVLGPAQQPRGPAGLAARLALRVGLLGGLLLGPAAAIGVGARLPGLISGARDAAVIALYLAIVFALAVTALSFVVMLATVAFARVGGGRFERRGPRAARLAAWTTTLATLVYLTLWWRNASAGFGWSAPVWTASALILAVAISLLLGHAQRIATLAVLASAAGPSAHLPPVAARSWRVVLGGGALAFAGAAVLLVVTAVDTLPVIERSPLTVTAGDRVRLIAIDGFDPALYQSGPVRPSPAMQRGLWDPSVRLALHDTSDPARAWTTVATGEPPEVHGVQRLETRRLAGIQGILSAGDGAIWQSIRAATDVARLTRPSIASRDERRSKTIWEVAEDAGLRTAVVNWWATWPAPSGPGIVITDRAVLRLEHGGPLDAEMAPADLYPVLRQHWPRIRASAHATAEQAFTRGETETLTVLRRSAELDATILGLLEALPGPPRDLDVIYLPGLDIAQHSLLGSAETGALSPSVVGARVEALKEYYGFLVTILQPLLNPADDQIVMVVTSPGRVQTPASGIFGVTHPSGGIELKEDAAATVVDVAPTVLRVLGLPLSRELAGKPVLSLIYEDKYGKHEPRYVDTYGHPFTPSSAREGKPLDQEMIDRLRSLGYIK